MAKFWCVDKRIYDIRPLTSRTIAQETASQHHSNGRQCLQNMILSSGFCFVQTKDTHVSFHIIALRGVDLGHAIVELVVMDAPVSQLN